MELPALLEREGISCDARADRLRLCPDCLTRDEELRRTAEVLGRVLAGDRVLRA
jgi:kynureninase